MYLHYICVTIYTDLFRCAELNLIHALADCDENIYKTGLPVHSTTDEEIGLLFVTLEGINLMKGISFESEL